MMKLSEAGAVGPFLWKTGRTVLTLLFVGILRNFDTIEEVMIDFKESLIGDHLFPAYSPRLKHFGVKGSKVKNIAIGAFAGISSKSVDIDLEDTNISNIPTAIFFPVPMSSHINNPA